MPRPVHCAQKLRFSSYCFDPTTGDLTREGIRRRLESQPAKILELLLEARGNLVPRSVLIAALWPGEIEGNFDRRLDKAVAKLRSTLNDDPAEPRYVETLKGRGYRFLDTIALECLNLPSANLASEVLDQSEAMVSNLPAEPLLEASSLKASSPKARSGFVRPVHLKWAFAFIGVIFLTFAAGLLHSRVSPKNHPVVLLLGFRDASQSSEDDWLSRSVEDWLSTDLRAGDGLQLVHPNNPELLAQTTARNCTELPSTVLVTARQLYKADTVVYGDFSEKEDGASGMRWTLNVCIRGTRDNKGPESLTVVGAKGNIAELVSNAGESIRSKLGVEYLSPQSLGYLRATLPTDLEAARFYAEGASALEHFQPVEATALLERAAQIEPQHAATHAALSTAWAILGYQRKSQQEATAARDVSKGLSPIQQLEYRALAEEADNNWPGATISYAKLVERYPDNIAYGVKLAHAEAKEAKPQQALEALDHLRKRNVSALTDPRVDLAEAEARSAQSDFKGQLSASIMAEKNAEAEGASLLIANARREQGNADDMLGNWNEALRLLQLAGHGFEKMGDRSGLADVLNRQADLAWKKGDPATASKLYGESLSLSNEVGYKLGVANALSHLGSMQMQTGRTLSGAAPGAVKMYRQAAALYHGIENSSEEGFVLSLLGDEAMQRSSYDEARSLYQRSMTLSLAANDRSRVAGRMLDLGIVDEAEGRNQEAIQTFRRSRQGFDDLGQRDRSAIAGIRLGISLFRSGDVDQAEQLLLSSLETMRSFGRPMQVREVLGDLADIELVKNPAKAETFAQEGLKMDLESDPAWSYWRYAQIAEIQAAQGKLKEAKESIQKAFPRGEQAVFVERLPIMLLARGEVRMKDGNYQGAEADLDCSLQTSIRRKATFLEMQSRFEIAKLHALEGRPSASFELHELQQKASRFGYRIFTTESNSLHSEINSAQKRSGA